MALTVPGLVNGSANLCFLNAIVQALASLSVYLDFLRSVLAAASDTTTPPEVVQALERTLTALQPQSRQQTFRPTMLVTALERSAVDTRSLLSPAAARQDHQDSHGMGVLPTRRHKLFKLGYRAAPQAVGGRRLGGNSAPGPLHPAISDTRLRQPS